MSTTQWTKRILTGTLGLAAVGVVHLNEGYSSTAYYDGAHVASICYGETKNVKIGMVKTKAQCDAQLQESITEHAKVFDKVPITTPDVVALGTIDMAYNVGVYGFNASRVKKAIIAGDYAQASKFVLEWRYIKVKGKRFDCSIKDNKICYGLWKRRVWQSKAIGNQFKTPQEALDELYNIYH